jgi:hypothetical protein
MRIKRTLQDDIPPRCNAVKVLQRLTVVDGTLACDQRLGRVKDVFFSYRIPVFLSDSSKYRFSWSV